MVGSLAVASAVATTPVAHAVPIERSMPTDGDDVRGSLDVGTVRYLHRVGEPAQWRITTYEPWTSQQIWDDGFLWIELDTRWGEGPDHYILLRSLGNRMVGALFRVALLPGVADHHVADLIVHRPDAYSLAVLAPLTALEIDPARSTFRWWVRTSFVSDRCPRTCFDLVPDDPANAPSQDAPGGPPPVLRHRRGVLTA